MMRRYAGCWLMVWMCVAWTAYGFTDDPALDEYWQGCALVFGKGKQAWATQEALTYRPNDLPKAGFTYFEGVEDATVTDSVLRFTLSGKTATLGWGNYAGRLTPSEFRDMGGWQRTAVLRIRQSDGPTTLRLWGWVDNRRHGDPNKPVTLAGADMTELDLGRLYRGRAWGGAINPDGFELTVKGRPGTQIEIEAVRFMQKSAGGYMRHEFTLPDGPVWRAVADVYLSGDGALYVNGHEIGPPGRFAPVEITEYLRSGANCIAFRGHAAQRNPYAYVQAGIVMASGWQTNVVTAVDGTWTTHAQEAPGWNMPGFDDSEWTTKRTPRYGALSYIFKHSRHASAYKGRLMAANPSGPHLVFRSDADALVQVNVPAGLAAHKPALGYRLVRCPEHADEKTVVEDAVSVFETDDDSLLYTLNLGVLEGGVYTLALDLNAEGTCIESRPRMPLLVIARHDGPATTGETMLEGLDVEIEDTIDFTDPDDPHPWVEVKTLEHHNRNKPRVEPTDRPIIVHTNGLVYRQTRPRAGSTFSVRLNAFKHPGDFYLMALDYPDNARRLTEAWIVQKADWWSDRQTGAAYESGGWRYDTGEMQTLYWIHVADPGVHSVDIRNGLGGQQDTPGAAAARLNVYHVKGNLPALRSGQARAYGILTERHKPIGSGAGSIFGSGPPRPDYRRLESWFEKGRLDIPDTEQAAFKEAVEAYKEHAAQTSPIQHSVDELVYLYGITDRYAQYLRFIGQNEHLMGCYQYNNHNSPMPLARDDWQTAQVPVALRRIMAESLSANGIDVHANLEVSQFTTINSCVNNLQVAAGADTVWMVDDDGRQYYGYRWKKGRFISQNWVHPAWRSSLGDLMKGVGRTLGHLPGFRGAFMWFGPIGVPMYAPAYITGGNYSRQYERSYDDVSFRQFEAAQELNLPVEPDDPQRFEKRAQLAQNNPTFKDKFRTWRCRAFHETISRALDDLQTRRSDLELLGMIGANPAGFSESWLRSDQPLIDYLREFGVDLDLFKGKWDLCAGRYTTGWTGSREQPHAWVAAEDMDFIGAFHNSTRRLVFVRTSWQETGWSFTNHEWMGDGGYPKLVAPYDWVVANTGQLTSYPNVAGFGCREYLTKALITGDVNFLVTGFTDHGLNLGHQSRIRPIMAVYTCLPRERFKRVLDTGLDTNLAIRQLTKADTSYLYVANPGYWPIDGDVTVKTSGAIVELVSGKPIRTRDEGDTHTLSLSMEPYGLAAYRVDAADLEVTDYRTGHIPQRELGFMQAMIERVDTLLNDPKIRLVLRADDREYMRNALDTATRLLSEQEYAAARMQLRDPRFRSYWKDFLEKAAPSIAFLPDSFETRTQENVKTAPVMRADRVDKAVTVDGRLEEAAWHHRPFEAGFVTGNNDPGLAETAVRVLYDDTHLYFAFACADRSPDALQSRAEKEQQIFATRDDALVLLIAPDPNKPVHYQMVFNAGGLRFDQRNVSADRDYAWDADWTTAVHVDKANAMWTAEAAIPFSAFDVKGPGNEPWRLNVGRVFRGRLIDAMTWSSTARGDAHAGSWHDTSQYGRLEFK